MCIILNNNPEISKEKINNTNSLISIIILNYNTRVLTLQCVESIVNHTPESIPIEFIIVDNASLNNEGAWLQDHFKDQSNCKVLKSHINLGFGSGNVMGVQYAKGDYFAFINSDVIFTEDCFSGMLTYMNANKRTGVCGVQMLNANGEKSISHRPFEGIRYKLFGKNFLYKTDSKIIKIHAELSEPTPVDFVMGSFMFFQEEAYRLCGGFDPNIFLYYEEFDICYRLKKLDYKTVYLPHLQYVHLEGQSGAYNMAMKKEHLLSYLYVLRKNFHFFKFWIIKTYLLITYFFKSIVKSRYRPLFLFLFHRGESLAHSLRHKMVQQKNES